MRVLLVDNHDSFTWNLVQALRRLGATVEVVPSDGEQDFDAFDALVVSPGPGRPEDAGTSVETIKSAPSTLPILGVCLGHQAIAVAFGGAIVPAKALVHGRTSAIRHDGRGVFAGVPSPFEATRYHSLAVDPEALPAELEACAFSDDGTIMGLRHRTRPVHGVQFHPESILTEEGGRLFERFLAIA
ncbi:MAG TPA: aminodeoxychorismate/anthranilate synthase component II [Candidatus Polarisedimenticolaceae bacterium]|nr:aminodeoxychorismate/anthranilate synthase component II [Candidatus Polarisedimenticolaceae bacterium]